MTICGYTSRNIPDPKTFDSVLDKRMNAKAKGDKTTANALKLVVNTTYGAMLNQYNDLFDPLMGRSVCISGQLYLLELCEHLYRDVPGLRVFQCNTDGIMIEFDDSQTQAVKEIVDEWQARTGFDLEEDKIVRLVQKDVNGYVEVREDGSVKKKGGYLVRGISKAGAFNVNNNATVIAEAIVDHFVNGTDVADYINAETDYRKFQLIAKAGSKYSEAYHEVNGERIPVQKVNRVYATSNRKFGKLFKVKAETGAIAKIESLPDNCIIDNDNSIIPNQFDAIDKGWYIKVARKRIDDFLGIKDTQKGKKKMAETKQTKTVSRRLMEARLVFLQKGVKKSGKNPSLRFQYFELDDIVPAITEIFNELDLLSIVKFEDGIASIDVCDADDTEKYVRFSVPMAAWEGNNAVNPMQAMGATITYYRRYLYMMALDICEPDDFEATLTKTDEQPKKVPVSEEKREEIKKDITAAKEAASPLQIRQLKAALLKLKNEKPEHVDYVTNVINETNGLTNLSKEKCEEIMKEVGEKV